MIDTTWPCTPSESMSTASRSSPLAMCYHGAARYSLAIGPPA
jgi:hypothetical protein